MATEVPNLWPVQAIKVDVLTPLNILRVQAGHFQQASKGLLEAEVSTTTSEGVISHQMDIVAPALGNYRHTILTVRHSEDMPYPATIYPLGPRLLNGINTGTASVVYSEGEFITDVSSVLQSGTVIALIQSLLARSREATAPPTPEATSES